MLRKIDLFELVTTQIGNIHPEFSDDVNGNRQRNLKEHIALTEDLLVELRSKLIKSPTNYADIKKSNETIKTALSDYKGIINEALEVLEKEEGEDK